MFVQPAVDALTGMISHLIFIVIAWKALESFNIQGVFKKDRELESKLLFILLSIVIGTTVSNFFLDFIRWSGQLSYLM
ncbi:DUF1146 domain-containing protein [Allobacillus sp. SKP2-8]|uniref:DUF1146 family protein n=1 Tax=unclassified Allobacillus TaxID=2628859 RepID=UPI0011829AA0|nr:DUF1146 family protein [Allobacillus sp. SKP2-8]TSJ65299.1 DUF1146 domain-containing protein [Allobacillus sp. SKP2-8]